MKQLIPSLFLALVLLSCTKEKMPISSVNLKLSSNSIPTQTKPVVFENKTSFNVLVEMNDNSTYVIKSGSSGTLQINPFDVFKNQSENTVILLMNGMKFSLAYGEAFHFPGDLSAISYCVIEN